MADCFIYVIGVESGPVKVGISSSPGSRLGAIQTGCHFKIDILYSRRCKDRDHALKNEKIFHDVYAEKRLVGEWFNIDADLAIEAIETGFDIEDHLEQEEMKRRAAAVLNVWLEECHGAHPHH